MTDATKYTCLLSNLPAEAARVAGGKGASLASMISAGFPVPPGFVILTDAFEEAAASVGLRAVIKSSLAGIDQGEYAQLEAASQRIRQALLSQPVPDHLSSEIFHAFDLLQSERVAVRSSATVEDSSVASWSGKLETYLNTGREELLTNVLKCWASLFRPPAIHYGYNKGIPVWQSSVAVVVQTMVDANVSGVAFTVDPETANSDLMIIEAVWGLGEYLVGGYVIPDRYVVDKTDGALVDVKVANQDVMLVRGCGQATGNVSARVPAEMQRRQKLTARQISELANTCLVAESHFGIPCDIEWVLSSDGAYYLTQSRPITTL